MRIIAFLFLSLLGLSLSAQEVCNTFFLFKEGVEWEYQNLNKKGKLESSSIHRVIEVTQTGPLRKAIVRVRLQDKKGEEMYSGQSEVSCDGEKIYFELNDLMPQRIKDMGSSGEVTMEGDGFLIPNQLKAGDQLPDSDNVIQIKVGAVNMKTEFSMTNFVVHGIENVNTPAGTFKAMKISYDNSAKMMMVKAEGSTITWYAKGVGSVKTEAYDKKGKLISSQVLARFEE